MFSAYERKWRFIMPGGYRWMYYATGQPGWMRFGFSPGWVGRSPTGLGPCASYLMNGRWPASNPQGMGYPPAYQGSQNPAYPPDQWPQAMQPAQPPAAPQFPGFGPAPANREQEISMLQEQAKALENQLQEIEKRIQQLRSE